jgi:hypothetical protein
MPRAEPEAGRTVTPEEYQRFLQVGRELAGILQAVQGSNQEPIEALRAMAGESGDPQAFMAHVADLLARVKGAEGILLNGDQTLEAALRGDARHGDRLAMQLLVAVDAGRDLISLLRGTDLVAAAMGAAAREFGTGTEVAEPQ